jgi:hypothetical protein
VKFAKAFHIRLKLRSERIDSTSSLSARFIEHDPGRGCQFELLRSACANAGQIDLPRTVAVSCIVHPSMFKSNGLVSRDIQLFHQACVFFRVGTR